MILNFQIEKKHRMFELIGLKYFRKKERKKERNDRTDGRTNKQKKQTNKQKTERKKKKQTNELNSCMWFDLHNAAN